MSPGCLLNTHQGNVMRSVDRRKLYQSLGFDKDRLPKGDGGFMREVELKDCVGNVMMTAKVHILSQKEKGRRHRVQVKCPKCGTWVGCGRLHMHIDTKTCRSAPAKIGFPKVEPTVYTLTSDEMVHTPGIFAWAVNGYKFDSDKPKMVRVIADTFNLKDEVATGLLDGTIPYTVVNDGVQFTHLNAKRVQ